jgi:hypothetical protein
LKGGARGGISIPSEVRRDKCFNITLTQALP